MLTLEEKKMICKFLGYKVDGEKFTTNGWETRCDIELSDRLNLDSPHCCHSSWKDIYDKIQENVVMGPLFLHGVLKRLKLEDGIRGTLTFKYDWAVLTASPQIKTEALLEVLKTKLKQGG